MTDPDDLTTDLSPAERFEAARKARAAHQAHPDLQSFRQLLDFELDAFQIRGCQALEEGRGVLVCAPTGAGKTVVGEFAVHRALTHGGKCFYTTPIKALSNQKYNDLVARYGPQSVGLLTGDTAVNSHAPVVVMTTEVLRNMLYAESPDLVDLSSVVMDEIHYLADKFRGAVWEEVILHLAPEVQLVGLSATVSNAEEFGAWLQEVRGEIDVVVDEHRPVPLWQHMMVNRRMYDLFAVDPGTGAGPAAHVRIDPELARAAAEAEARTDRWGGDRRGRGDRLSGGRPPAGWRPPARVDVLTRLDAAGLLPAITFIFSRAGCDAAVAQCVRADLMLTTEVQRERIREVIDRRTADLPEADLAVLGYWDWREALERGIAAHHAGLLPAFKETVEELFVAGLVKAVFATETLALGINMPARTVVLERLTKYNGEGHVDLTPGEYTQLTGRAGRRGIDIEGHAVVIWAPGMDPRAVAGLASKRLYPLRSSFRPSYNMAVNLTDRLGRERARHLLEQSFAQFQSNASVVGLARQVRRNTATIDDHTRKMACHLGDAAEYHDLLSELSSKEKQASKRSAVRRQDETEEGLAALRRGDVIAVSTGRRAGLAVVIDPGAHPDGSRPLVVTAAQWAGRLTARDFRGPVPVLGRLKVGSHIDYRSIRVRRELATALHRSGIAVPGRTGKGGKNAPSVEDAELAALRRAIRAHPVHGCAEKSDHLQWARRRGQLLAENRALTAKVDHARDSLGDALERILGLLTDRGYLAGDRLTDAGRMLARIWSESDLVVAECLREGAWEGLDAAELAAVVSVLVFEARRDSPADPRPPTPAIFHATEETLRIWKRISAEESRRGLPKSREPDLGFVAAVAAWADGRTLTESLNAALGSGTELSAGDFVRWCRQVVDLLDQIQGVAPAGVADAAAAAVSAIRRGVVALGAG